METCEEKRALQANQQNSHGGGGAAMKNSVADMKQRRIKDINKKD